LKTIKLVQREFSWNRLASIIYIEQPCGVGFSYGGTPDDYTSNDNITAVDNFLFLQGFFEVFPEFADNEFWITGESYGGVYIPTLAYTVLTNTSDTSIATNLKRGGLMLGNPVTNCPELGVSYGGQGGVLNTNNQLNLFYWHGMVSRRTYDDWNNNACDTSNPPSVAKCDAIYAEVLVQIGPENQPLQNSDKNNKRSAAQGFINPDMLYFSFCTGNGTLDFDVASVPDCFDLDTQVSTYLNTPAVQTAIHAQLVDKKEWEECGGVLYTKTAGPIPDYLEFFFANAPSMRILYYSGDCDIDTVPFAETQRCLETMDQPITQEWRPWIVNREIAGYIEVYTTYTFTTLKGAGHEAPQFQPAAAFVMFSSFLNNETFPAR